jgi:hypothetical protein
MDFLLARIGADPGFTMTRELAYVLATIQWETASTFQPIRERRASRERHPRHWEIQNRYWPSGFYGRGYIQITWRENYLNAGKKLAGLTFDVDGQRVTIASETFAWVSTVSSRPRTARLSASLPWVASWYSDRSTSRSDTTDWASVSRPVGSKDRATRLSR